MIYPPCQNYQFHLLFLCRCLPLLLPPVQSRRRIPPWRMGWQWAWWRGIRAGSWMKIGEGEGEGDKDEATPKWESQWGGGWRWGWYRKMRQLWLHSISKSTLIDCKNSCSLMCDLDIDLGPSKKKVTTEVRQRGINGNTDSQDDGSIGKSTLIDCSLSVHCQPFSHQEHGSLLSKGYIGAAPGGALDWSSWMCQYMLGAVGEGST